jgi:hypothetical protein
MPIYEFACKKSRQASSEVMNFATQRLRKNAWQSRLDTRSYHRM